VRALFQAKKSAPTKRTEDSHEAPNEV